LNFRRAALNVCLPISQGKYSNPTNRLHFLQEIEGIPTDSQVLLFGSKILHDSQTLKQAGLRDHSTISIVSRLRGGKPVKVKMMTQHLPCGPEVTIDIEKDATKDEIKHKLAEVTGVPVEHQKVLLSGINQIMMGDKR